MSPDRIREVLILSDPDVVKLPKVLVHVFNEMTRAFSDCGIPVRTITSVKELHNDAIVFSGDIFFSEDPASIINRYDENAIYVLWHFGSHKPETEHLSLRFLWSPDAV